MPAVAVVIPCYNHARFLSATVASVVGQTFHDWEIIIVDNGSTDDSNAVAQRLIARFHGRPIRLITQAALGAGAGRNAAIRATSAPYVLALDADDLVAARYLERTVPILEKQPEVGFVTVNTRFFGAEQGQWSGGEPSRERMLYDARTTVTALFRRMAWEQVDGFSERVGYEDWDFWLRLLEACWTGVNVAETLFWYRRKVGSTMMNYQRRDLFYRAQVVADHPRLYPPPFQPWARAVLAHNQRTQMPLLYGWYAALIARHAPNELAKTLLRPAFKALGPQAQMWARGAAQWLRVSRAS